MSTISQLGHSLFGHTHGAGKGKPSAAASALSSLLKSSGAGQAASDASGAVDKLQSAVTSALSATQADSSTDANQTIQDTLTKLFTNGSLGQSADDDGTAAASNAQPTKSFEQILKGFGVTAQQFQTDIKAALQKAGKSGKGLLLDAVG